MLRIRDELLAAGVYSDSTPLPPAPALIFAPVSATREPCRRVRAEQSLPRFEPCVPHWPARRRRVPDRGAVS